MYMRLSEGTEIVHVTDEETLQHVSVRLREPYVCAIDAEWEPGVYPASATLVQLALRHDAEDTLILLLDLLLLPTDAARTFLQKLFRNKAILKVGYGILHDLAAISAATGPHGGNCVAVVQPLLDLRLLSSQLRLLPRGHRSQTGARGLGGLVEYLFGQPMDKRLQCSAWHERPLSQEQVQYAALDAACLLGILAAVLAKTNEATNGPNSSAKPADESDRRVTNANNVNGTSDGSAVRDGSSSSAADTASAVASLQTDFVRQLNLTADKHSIDGCHLTEELVVSARDKWGCRLEHDGGRFQLIRLKDRQPESVVSEGFVDHNLQSSRLPARIPWEGQIGNGSQPKFVADVPQEGLARQLRLCGFDAKVAPNRGKGERHLVYRYMVDTAEQEGRVILTGDRIFARRRLSEQTFLVRGADKKEQLADLLSVFGLTVEPSNLLSRCAKCNGTFIPRPMVFSELPERSRRQIPPLVVRAHDAKFWVCASCKQVYWRGSQFERCIGSLAARLKQGPILPLG